MIIIKHFRVEGTQLYQVFFGHPLCLIPSSSHVIQRLTQSLSSFRSTCSNHLNLLFLIIKLTGSNPKSSPLFFLSFSLTPYIHLIIISVRFSSINVILGQVSLACIRNSSHKSLQPCQNNLYYVCIYIYKYNVYVFFFGCQ